MTILADIGIFLGGCGSVGLVGLQIATYRQAHAIKKETSALKDDGIRREAKIDNIGVHVNGMSEKLAAGAFAAGKAEGVQEERDNPMSPTKDR